MSDENFDLLTRCLKDRSEGKLCPECPINRMEGCSFALRKMEYYQRQLRTRNIPLDAQEVILQETFENIFIAYKENHEEGRTYVGKCDEIFESTKADYFRRLRVRFNELASFEVKKPYPFGLEDVVNKNPSHLSLDAGILSCTPRMPEVLYRSLLALSDDEKWLKNIVLLYRCTWQGLIVPIHEAINQDNLTSKPETPEAIFEEKESPTLTPFLKLWLYNGGEKALNCIKFFKEHGEKLLIKEDNIRENIAAREGVARNTIDQRIAGCMDLIHHVIVNFFRNCQEFADCRDLYIRFVQIEVRDFATGKRKKLGRKQRMAILAEENGYTVGSMEITMDRCALLAMEQLGALS